MFGTLIFFSTCLCAALYGSMCMGKSPGLLLSSILPQSKILSGHISCSILRLMQIYFLLVTASLKISISRIELLGYLLKLMRLRALSIELLSLHFLLSSSLLPLSIHLSQPALFSIPKMG